MKIEKCINFQFAMSFRAGRSGRYSVTASVMDLTAYLMKRLLLAGFVVAACVVSGRASTLADYRHRVSGAIRTIQPLQLAQD